MAAPSDGHNSPEAIDGSSRAGLDGACGCGRAALAASAADSCCLCALAIGVATPALSPWLAPSPPSLPSPLPKSLPPAVPLPPAEFLPPAVPLLPPPLPKRSPLAPPALPPSQVAQLATSAPQPAPPWSPQRPWSPHGPSSLITFHNGDDTCGICLEFMCTENAILSPCCKAQSVTTLEWMYTSCPKAAFAFSQITKPEPLGRNLPIVPVYSPNSAPSSLERGPHRL
mmetsp:Transcript_124225/g.356928  ORF Transcript_124225/g.356928 Transcript_124225/m.356928 type:complete len:227 (+) Transcript_124225:122-802(+)